MNAQEMAELVVGECEVVAHLAKTGTDHELHDGWSFVLDDQRHRVLQCGCGVVLIEGTR